MKKIFSKTLLVLIGVLIVGINQVWAASHTFDGTEKLYVKNVKPSGWGLPWMTSGWYPWIHIYDYQEGGDEADLWLTLESGSANTEGAIYSCTPPAGTYTDVIIVRSNVSGQMYYSEQAKTIAFPEDESKNYINNFVPSSWGTDPSSWSKYGATAALVGDFNDWTPNAGMFGDWDDNKGKVYVNLTAGETYEFLILVGETYWGLDDASVITSSITSWWLLKSGQGNLSVTADETGEYIFQWNKSTNYFGVYYPKARLTKNKVFYFDASASTTDYWNQADFSADFYFRYYDTEGNIDDGQMCYEEDKIGTKAGGDGPVYYQTSPDNNLIGSIVIDRYNAAGDSKWNTSGAANGHARSSSAENCAYITEATSWGPSLGWKTYCPPMSAASLSDNSTSVISWTSGNGTSGNPYLVPATGTIKVSASATSAVEADDNMTKKYDFKVNDNEGGASSAQSGTGNTFSKTSLTNNHTYEISLDTWNYYNGTDGTKKTDATHIWYKALNMYSVTPSLTNMSVKDGERTGTDAAAYQIAYSVILTANTGYDLPASVTVTCGGSTDITTNCTWTQATGTLYIPAAQVTGNITITAAGVEKTYAISYAAGTYGSGSLSGGTKYHFTDYTLSDNSAAFTRDNYVYDGWSTNIAGSSKDYNLGGSYTTNAAQTFYPHWVAAYNVTHTLTHAVTASGATGAKAAVNGVAYTATFTADAGYELPSAITVTVGGESLTKDTHYTWSVSDGEGTLTVLAANVTGAIVVTITGTPVTLEFTGSIYWNQTSSWTPACIPTIEHDVVIPQDKYCRISNCQTAQAKSVMIDNSDPEKKARLIIENGSGLVVAEGITAKHSADGLYEATNDMDLWIRSDYSNNSGLVCGNTSANTQATYVLASTVWRYDAYYINQYVGIPFASMSPYQWYSVYVFEYDDEHDAWKNPSDGDLKPFTAYDIISQSSEENWATFYTDGILNLPGIGDDVDDMGVEKRKKVLECGWRAESPESIDKEDGHQDYLFANSWTAPISIADIDEDDYVTDELVGTIYIFNAGYIPADGDDKVIGDLSGQWSSISFKAASYTTHAVIPATQAFMVTAKQEGASLTLDYKKHVYDPAKTSVSGMNNDKLKSPRRERKADAPTRLLMTVQIDDVTADELYLFEREDFTSAFDNGWDGYKILGESFAPQLYAVNGESILAIDATPEMDNTVVGFKAGTLANEYTFAFDYNDDEPLYLYDKDLNLFTQITSEATYTFTTDDTAEHQRFMITRSNAPQIVTAFEEVETEEVQRAEKFMENNMLFIRRGDKVYSVDGSLVK